MLIYFHFGSRFDFGFLIRTIANAISAGDERFRDLKLLSKDSACQVDIHPIIAKKRGVT